MTEKTMNFFGTEKKVFKANLHTHSTRSDGRYAPQEIVDLYANAGYDVLAMTDHRITSAIGELEPRGMLLLRGAEIHPRGPRNITWHLLCIDLDESTPAAPPYPDAQEVVDRVKAAGGLVYNAHPYWCGFTSEEVMILKDLDGMEIANSSCRNCGREYNDCIWDDLLMHGHLLPAIGVDDTHSEVELFYNWTMIAADSCSREDIVSALRKGQFYSTQGPEFTFINWENGVLSAEFSEAAEVTVIMDAPYGTTFADPRFPEKFPPCSSLSVPLKEESGHYARIRIRDSAGRYAWSNPVWTGGKR